MTENRQGRFHASHVQLLLAEGAFYSIRKSEISFVLRIIKRNFKLKFSLRAWGSGPRERIRTSL